MTNPSEGGKSVIITPGKDVVASTATAFKAELYAIMQEKPKKLVIDLTGVEMIDSIGIGVIIAAYNSLRAIGGLLEIINASRNIYKVFLAMRLNHHFSIKKIDESY